MTAVRQVVPLDSTASFRLEQSPNLDPRPEPHFHPELELVFIEHGHGRLFVGDHMETCAPGSLVLLGSNLAHSWQPAPSSAETRQIIVHMRPNFIECICNDLPELTPIRAMMKRAQGGLRFLAGESNRIEQATELLTQLPALSSLEAVSQLIAIFTALAKAPGQQIGKPRPAGGLEEEDRLARVLHFLYRHFREPLSLADIAQIAAMSPNAFCRYFRSLTGRNIFNVLAELRINYASRQLASTDDKIATIALESGFESVSSFNRQFLRFKRMPPFAYRKCSRRAVLTAGLASA